MRYSQNAYTQEIPNTKLNKYLLKELCDINPSVDMKEIIKQDKNISFIPMEMLATDGKSFTPLYKKVLLHYIKRRLYTKALQNFKTMICCGQKSRLVCKIKNQWL